MKSRWYEFKETAIKLRKKGFSIRNIEKKFKIPRSTLGGWFKNIELSERQKKQLLLNWKNGLTKARKKAIIWHNKKKEKRLKIAETAAMRIANNIDFRDKNIIELALAVLYLGEGAKKNLETAIGSSDPAILKFFIAALRNIYKTDLSKIRCELYLRADQNPAKTKIFWSKELKLPFENFKQVNIDKRTIGVKTYKDYNGVCNIRCGNVAIQRKLMYLSKIFIKKALIKYKY